MEKNNDQTHESFPHTSSNRRRKILASLIFAGTLLFLLLAFIYREHLDEYRSLGLLGVFFVNFVGSATIFLPTPAILSIPIFAAIYPPLLVSLSSAAGSALGETTGYLLGVSSGEIIDLKKHKFLNYLQHVYFKKYGFLTIFFFTLIPNPIFDGIGLVAGVSSYPASRFIAAVFIGRFIRDTLIAFGTHIFI